MAHFLKPYYEPSGDYDVDSKLAPYSVSSMRIPIGGSRDILLWGGGGLSLSSDDFKIVPDEALRRRRATSEKDTEIVTLVGRCMGTCKLEARLKRDLWLSLSIEVIGAEKIGTAVLNLNAKEATLAALQDPSVEKIKFTVDGFSISPENYEEVNDAIVSGSITVRYDGSLKNPQTGLPYCQYNPLSDILTVGFGSSASANTRAIIIHEATHAACDIDIFTSMTNTTSEILAYIAQTIVMTTYFPEALPIQSDPIIAASQPLATIVLSGGSLGNDKLTYIRKAIQNHPMYSSTARENCRWDGVLPR